MKERFSELRCEEVTNVPDGCRLGYTSDVELETDSGRILALIVPGHGRFFGLLPSQEEYVVPWACVRCIGSDIILVDVCPGEVKCARGKKACFP